ncbi:digestive cysteine proteinase 1 [Diorhabda sublineata]|uniref:digestive cysteine proteinase 1 n=1 Tax=Diorhabda sublineata TaxID=1163346 RepID=UPI0024E0DF17|nr:digestive cysteine proteinase 1 [Diorhabda sublineata]
MGSLNILLLVSSFISLGICDPNPPTPVWKKTYSVKGVLNIPYAEIQEPFSCWYDEPSKQSRIDYYGDMVQTYQLGGTGYGTSLKVAPITTETEENVRTCLQVNGTSENRITPQSVLPDLTDFKKEGTEVVNGFETEKWVLVEVIGHKINKYSMWIKSGEVPVRYEMKGFNSLLGSHYDHYYLDYVFYDTSDIPEDTFRVATDMVCSSFPGPGDKHIYTFNPIAEFIKPEYTGHLDFEFKKFIHKHRRQYADEKEHTMRKSIFTQNIRFIYSVNRQNKGYTLTVNHLADKSPQELKALRGKKYSGVYNGGKPFPYNVTKKDDIPQQFDWRIFGAVTPVKDQSVCGSCWSFGTVGAIEGAYFLKNGNLVRLSQQALIDCSWGYGNNGCDGGEDFRAYQWILKHGGLPTEEDYGPYLGQDGYCHATSLPKVAKITGWVNITSGDENALRLALYRHGPISVAIDASHRTFSFYSNGIYYDASCGNTEEDLDHAVLAVGYGSIKGQNYWLIKNSWSTYWGNDGYILMSSKDNNCGVMTTPTYVTM